MGLTRDDLAQLEQLMRPLVIRAANAVARGSVQLVDDSADLQLLQLGALTGETIDRSEHFQPYGFSSVPLVGAEHVTIFPNGDRSHPITLATPDRQYRPKDGQPGDVNLYHFTGAKITFTADGDIIATPAAGRKVLAGGPGAATPPALSSELADLKARVAAWTPVPNDGGASLKPVIAAWPVPGATKVDVE